MPTDRRNNVACVILGAGEGHRLRPLTDATPKPLLTILDRPIVDLLLDRVAHLGDISVFVNLYHAAETFGRHLAARDSPSLLWRTEPTLTGPAGALRIFANELARFKTIIVLSGDVTFGDPLDQLLDAHCASGAELTFAVTEVTDARRFGVLELDSTGRVLRAREKPNVPANEPHWVSAGLYCLQSELLTDIPEDQLFDFAADLAPALIAAGRRVQGHRLLGPWSDLGQPSTLRQANLDAVAGGVHMGANVLMGRGVEVIAPTVIGRDSILGAGSWIQNSVLLPGTVISPGTVLIDGIVGPRHSKGME